jgi:chorismate mutase
VRSLKEYKESQGLSFHDTAQEEWIVTFLSRANRGPMSHEGLADIYALILAVVKREVLGLESRQEGRVAVENFKPL